MTETHYDVFIIGGGQAGNPLADKLAASGKTVALAERKDLGGSCVNFGCTPTKAAIASAQLAHQARRGAEFGLHIPTVAVDFAAVLARARAIALDSRNGLDKGYESSDNPKLVRGQARIEGKEGAHFRIRVEEQVFTAEQVVLNVGTRSEIPPIDGLHETAYLHAGNWLEQNTLPAQLAVIGGGYIGLEMGQFYQRMGSQVTIIEPGERVLAHEDTDISHALQNLLAREGVAFQLKTKIERVAQTQDGLTLHLQTAEGTKRLSATHIFVATGRKPNTDDLGLDSIGVQCEEHGFVRVDERLATTVAGVWAAGDMRGGPMFTHTSWDDHRILVSQMIGDKSRTTHRIVPYAVYTEPQLGRVGMTETEAQKSGRKFKIGRFEMQHNGKAAEIGATDGFIKVLVDADSKEILGAAVLSAEGSELVHLFIDLMNAHAPYTVIRDAIHIHPTLAEAVQSAVAAIEEAE